jgi:hypothetical protein
VNELAKVERHELEIHGMGSIKIDYIIPAIYDDMDNINNNKISEQYPKFGFGDLLDEILEDFGGVLDIFICEWDDIKLEGEVVCLINNWRVFRYYLKQNELSVLDREKRISLINKDCLIFEDIDEWGSWKELNGDRIEREKKEIVNKKEIENQKQSVQNYISDLQDFFNGDIEKIQQKMQQNKGV